MGPGPKPLNRKTWHRPRLWLTSARPPQRDADNAAIFAAQGGAGQAVDRMVAELQTSPGHLDAEDTDFIDGRRIEQPDRTPSNADHVVHREGYEQDAALR